MPSYVYKIVFNDKQIVAVLKVCAQLPGRLLREITQEIAQTELTDITESFGDAAYTQYKRIWITNDHRLYMVSETYTERSVTM